jgi:hypothetical protein
MFHFLSSSLSMGSKGYPETSHLSYNITSRHNSKELQHLCQYVFAAQLQFFTHHLCTPVFLRRAKLKEEIQNKESENKYVLLIRKPGNVLLTGLKFQHRAFLIRCLKVTKKFSDRRQRVWSFIRSLVKV